MRTTHVTGALLLFLGCTGGFTEDPGTDGSGGAAASGGATATGGTVSSGGSSASGGSVGSGGHTGGTTGSGGAIVPGSGGQSGSHSGGITGSGGTMSPGSGGVTASGGATGSGGIATGGTVNPTGGRAQGGRGGSVNGSGGMGAGGRGATGGRASGGSGTGSGGTTSGSGGTGPITSTCTEADKAVSNNGTGKHCGFTYEYWKDSGNGTLTLTKDGYNVQWSSVNDLLGRKGMRPGSDSLVVNYTADYQPNGNSYLCVYGWTRNPLVEYYIVDSWGNWRPPGGEGKVGMVTSDGGTYETYKISRTGSNIDGNGPFTQYWSVRTSKASGGGTITVANHFNAWKNSGMPMGSLYEVSMTVEGYQSSGTANVKFTMK
ncbi:MAG TPA: glycoside hydrolase family 11 protein [Polyangia bacterium]|nr:glycoside hydrolase family 11 protein [Polyangia bacterium]